MAFNPTDFDDLFCTSDSDEITSLCKKIFYTVDTDKNGKLDKTEMHLMIHTYVTYMHSKGWMKNKLSAADQIDGMVNEFINNMDTNKDGTITLEEFTKFCLETNGAEDEGEGSGLNVPH